MNRVLNGPPPRPKAAAGVAPSPAAGATTLGIVDTVTGTGRVAKTGDHAVVHYTGTLTDGTVFDSSRTRNSTFDFELGAGRVIKGWDQGMPGMRIGGRRKLTIPPDLAYGDRGVGSTIPPHATLVFDVELIDPR